MTEIIAVISTDRSRVGGGAPIFYAADEEELQRIAFKLEKILDANAHDLRNGTMIVVRHA